MEGGPCVVIHRFVRKFHIRGVRLQLQRPGMGKNFKRSVLRINLRSIVEKSIYIYRYKSKQKYCSKIFWTRLKTLEAIFTGKFWAKNLISPGSLTALRCELQGRGLRLSPSRVKSRSGNFFRVNVGRPAVATSAKEQPFRSDLSLSRVSWWFIVDHSGCHLPSIFCSTMSTRDLEGSRFWNFARIGNERWRERLGWVRLCFRSFGWFGRGISQSTVELRSRKFLSFLSVKEFSS